MGRNFESYRLQFNDRFIEKVFKSLSGTFSLKKYNNKYWYNTYKKMLLLKRLYNMVKSPQRNLKKALNI